MRPRFLDKSNVSRRFLGLGFFVVELIEASFSIIGTISVDDADSECVATSCSSKDSSTDVEVRPPRRFFSDSTGAVLLPSLGLLSVITFDATFSIAWVSDAWPFCLIPISSGDETIAHPSSSFFARRVSCPGGGNFALSSIVEAVTFFFPVHLFLGGALLRLDWLYLRFFVCELCFFFFFFSLTVTGAGESNVFANTRILRLLDDDEDIIVSLLSSSILSIIISLLKSSWWESAPLSFFSGVRGSSSSLAWIRTLRRRSVLGVSANDVELRLLRLEGVVAYSFLCDISINFSWGLGILLLSCETTKHSSSSFETSGEISSFGFVQSWSECAVISGAAQEFILFV